MGIEALYTGHGVSYGATVVEQITDTDLNTNPTIQKAPTDGGIGNRHISNRRVDPRMTFSSMDIDAIIDEFDSGALWTKIDDLVGGFSIWQQQVDEGGTRTTGSTHRKINTVQGLVLPRTLNASDDSDLSIDMEVVPTWDGTNDPIVITDSQALPALGGSAAHYAMAKTTIGGISFVGKQSLSIDFGLSLFDTSAGDNDLYLTWAAIKDIASVLNMTFVDATKFADAVVPLMGKASEHADSTIYFRKRTATGFEADASLVHISCTIAGLLTPDNPWSFSAGNDGGTVQMTLNSKYDGTNLPLVWSTGVAIPA